VNYNDIVFVKENTYDAYEDATISAQEIFIFLLYRPDKHTILVERLNGTIMQFNEELIEARTAEQTIEILNKKINHYNDTAKFAHNDIGRHEQLIEKAKKKIKSAEFSLPKLQANFDRLSVAKRLMGNTYHSNTAEAKAFREECTNAQNLYYGTKNAIQKHTDRIEHLNGRIKYFENIIEKSLSEAERLEIFKERYNV
jgi:chromosome segregation ATPase